MAKDVLDTIMSIQPKDSGSGSSKARESVVHRMASNMLSKLPEDYVPHEVRPHFFLFVELQLIPLNVNMDKVNTSPYSNTSHRPKINEKH